MNPTARRLLVKLSVHLIMVVIFSAINIAAVRMGVAKYNVDPVTSFDVLHYTFIMHTSTGLGDIYPVSPAARVLSWVHTFGFLVLMIA